MTLNPVFKIPSFPVPSRKSTSVKWNELNNEAKESLQRQVDTAVISQASDLHVHSFLSQRQIRI